MLRNHDFIVFSDDWGRHPFSCQHIMERFLPDNRILWVNTIGLRTPRLSVYDIKRSCEKLLSWARPGRNSEKMPLSENLRVTSPVMAPFSNIGAVRLFNRKSVIRSVRKAMRGWGMDSPVLLATLPNAADYLGSFNERAVIYYCVDDFVSWPGMNQPKLVRELEDALLAKADLTAAVSEALCASRGLKTKRIRLLSHGVDLEHFAKAARTHPVPDLPLKTGKPIIGFFGFIDERFDVDLVHTVLAARPDWQMLCIGNKCVSLDLLEKLPNFFRLPAVPYSDLPAYASCFDVAALPYRLNDPTNASNPLKLREYIATGKPVVSSSLPEALRYKGHIQLADTAEQFLTAVEESLKDQSNPDERRSVLAGESWGDKAELLSGWILEVMRNDTDPEDRP